MSLKLDFSHGDLRGHGVCAFDAFCVPRGKKFEAGMDGLAIYYV